MILLMGQRRCDKGVQYIMKREVGRNYGTQAREKEYMT